MSARQSNLCHTTIFGQFAKAEGADDRGGTSSMLEDIEGPACRSGTESQLEQPTNSAQRRQPSATLRTRHPPAMPDSPSMGQLHLLTQPLTTTPTSFTNTTFRIRLSSHLDAHRSQFASTVLHVNYARLIQFTDCSRIGLSAVLLASSMHQLDIIQGIALPAIVRTSLVWSSGRGIEVEESQVICSPLCGGQYRRYNGSSSENKDERREMDGEYKALLL